MSKLTLNKECHREELMTIIDNEGGTYCWSELVVTVDSVADALDCLGDGSDKVKVLAELLEYHEVEEVPDLPEEEDEEEDEEEEKDCNVTFSCIDCTKNSDDDCCNCSLDELEEELEEPEEFEHLPADTIYLSVDEARALKSCWLNEPFDAASHYIAIGAIQQQIEDFENKDDEE